MAIASMQDMLVYDLAASYDMEQVLLQGMQEMHRMSQNSRVQQMIERHINQSKQQITNLEQCFSELGQQPQRLRCYAAEGLVNDFRALAKEIKDPMLTDLVILGSWARAEHLEIASYRGMVDKAQLMGNTRLVQNLQQILTNEEQEAKNVEQTAQALGQQMMGGMGRAMGGNIP